MPNIKDIQILIEENQKALEDGLNYEDEGPIREVASNFFADGIDPLSVLDWMQTTAEALNVSWQELVPFVKTVIEHERNYRNLEVQSLERLKQTLLAWASNEIELVKPQIVLGVISPDDAIEAIRLHFFTKESLPLTEILDLLFEKLGGKVKPIV